MLEPLRFAPTALGAFAREVLTEAGASTADARLCAEALLDASLRGIDSHGVDVLLPRYASEVRAGVGTSGRAPRIEVRGPIARVHGNGALGPRTGRIACDAAAAAAREHGVAVAVAEGVGYLGALSWLVAPPAETGLLVLAACNGMAFVAPHGGRSALHGTNPIAVAVPAQPDPFVLDMRTNAFAMEDFRRALATGEPLPSDALSDKTGRPLRDAASIVARGWKGIVSQPLAGARGYGLALVVDVLTAGLAGGRIGREIDETRERDGLALFVLALDPSAFGPPAGFTSSLERLLTQIAETPPIGPDPVRYPGERAAAERRRRMAEGIPIEPSRWRQMRDELAVAGLLTPAPQPDEGPR